MRSNSTTAVRSRFFASTFLMVAWCCNCLRPRARLPRATGMSDWPYVLTVALGGIAALILCLLALTALLIPCLLTAVHLFVN